MKWAAKLVVVLIMTVMACVPASAEQDASAVWSGAADMSWYDEEVTEFTLYTAEQLAGLAQLVNDGNSFNGRTVRLGCDIRLNSGSFNEYGAYDGDKSSANYWTPIGRERSYFSGTFDGNGYTVSGLYISTAEGHVGLFGYNTGTISNVNVVDGSVRGGRRTAAVCGYNRMGVIEGCYSDCYVYATWWGGGICGVNSGTGRISRCANAGTVKADTNSGGICGMNKESQAVIDNCFNSGAVYGFSADAGGICGLIDGGQIQSCVNVGAVVFSEPYPIACRFTPLDGSVTTISDCYYVSGQEFCEDSDGTGLTVRQMCDGAGSDEYFAELDENIWQRGSLDVSDKVTAPDGMQAVGEYPRLKGVGEPVYAYSESSPDTGITDSGAAVAAFISAAACLVLIKKKKGD
ncbi:MAG: hypothetical protein J6A16_04970 [Oscillospiraceae bacterium]|nr:hypothetical protein [Oscillospiraceae bacterium]